jgi:hypothetical protein
MKKGELVAAAERRLAQSRWLPEILKRLNQERGEGKGESPPPLSKYEAMSQQLQSASPEPLCFAIIDVMSNELTPLIQLLKKSRTANELTQAQAVAAFQAEGLPATLEAIRETEEGRARNKLLNRHTCPG